ncbi:MAG: type II secretion system protein [Sulfurimonas sp.]
MIKKRYAFTMLELIFVIVVMGILGKYGVELLARAYDNFIMTKVNDDLQSRSGAAVEFISKRLEHRLKKSSRGINTGVGAWDYVHGGTSDDSADVLEWIAVDDDSYRGSTTPLWSGVLDLNSSTGTSLVSPGSNFGSVNTNIQVLSNGGSDMNDSAIFFVDSQFSYTNPWGYNGAIANHSETMHRVQVTTNDTLAPLAGTGDLSGVEASEYYKLSWTANAVAMENQHGDNNELYDLYFYYDYQPWRGETYIPNGKRVLLAQDISAFRFRSAGSLIKIQVCAKSDLIANEEYALCKEKTVF